MHSRSVNGRRHGPLSVRFRLRRRYFNSGGTKNGQFHEIVFRVDFGPLLGRILPTAAHALRVPAMFLLITSPD